MFFKERETKKHHLKTNITNQTTAQLCMTPGCELQSQIILRIRSGISLILILAHGWLIFVGVVSSKTNRKEKRKYIHTIEIFAKSSSKPQSLLRARPTPWKTQQHCISMPQAARLNSKHGYKFYGLAFKPAASYYGLPVLLHCCSRIWVGRSRIGFVSHQAYFSWQQDRKKSAGLSATSTPLEKEDYISQ